MKSSQPRITLAVTLPLTRAQPLMDREPDLQAKHLLPESMPTRYLEERTILNTSLSVSPKPPCIVSDGFEGFETHGCGAGIA